MLGATVDLGQIRSTRAACIRAGLRRPPNAAKAPNRIAAVVVVAKTLPRVCEIDQAALVVHHLFDCVGRPALACDTAGCLRESPRVVFHRGQRVALGVLLNQGLEVVQVRRVVLHARLPAAALGVRSEHVVHVIVGEAFVVAHDDAAHT
eukprot:3007200-Prymnesium_polylepis.1